MTAAEAEERGDREPLRSRLFPYRRIWDRIQPWYGGSPKELVGLSGFAVLSGLAEAGMLYLVVRAAVAIAADDDVVDITLGPIQHDGVSLGPILLLAVAALVIRALLAFGVAWLTASVAVKTLAQSRHGLLESYLGAEWSMQAGEREGNLQELLSNNINRITGGAALLSNALAAFFNFVAILASAVLVSPVAAGVSLGGAVLLAVLLRPISTVTRRLSAQYAKANLDYTSRVAETVRMAQEIQVFEVSRRVGDVMAREVQGLVEPFRRSRFLNRVTADLYQSIAIGFVVAAMAVVWETGAGDAAQLGVVVLLLLRALNYSQLLQATYQQANELAPYLDQLVERDAAYRAAARQPGHRPLGRVTSLRVDGVRFAYGDGPVVLKDVSFDIGEGEAIGIVGPSGSGKSTLVQLLLRLRTAQQGSYYVDGVPAGEYDLDDWSRQFVFVPQDNKLMRGTVADNIRFHRDLDDAAVERAARLAHLHDEIMAFPAGYATEVGSGAADLSGGQRQRLGLARALATHPSVLVLDEPTSALDMRSEVLVQQTLQDLRGELTLVVIAHRISTLSICDRIMVLRGGEVEAFGPPSEVATGNDFYRNAVELSQSASPEI